MEVCFLVQEQFNMFYMRMAKDEHGLENYYSELSCSLFNSEDESLNFESM